MRILIDGLRGEWKTVEQQIEELSAELERMPTSGAGCIRMQKIPAIGLVVATTIVTFRATWIAFSCGRVNWRFCAR
jgi:transposase